jgi:Ulp1 family protease
MEATKQSVIADMNRSNHPHSVDDDTVLFYYPFGSSFRLLKKDFLQLNNNGWFSDNLIQLQLHFFEDLYKDSKVHLFSSHFLSKLLYSNNETTSNAIFDNIIGNDGKNRGGVIRWSKGVDIFAKDFVAAILNIHGHFSTVIIVRPNLIMHPGTDGDNLACIVHIDSCKPLHTNYSSELHDALKQ